MTLGNLVGKVNKQVLTGAAALALTPPSERATASVTVHVLQATVATFTYQDDKNSVTITSASLPANQWLFGVATFSQASGLSVCYIN